MTGPRRANRGPSAAADNRRALVAAAVEVFGEQGIDAPLSAVAKRAGVGQGSLYRHFPDRMSLALAVFEDNIADLESLAALDGTDLEDLLALVTKQIVASVAVVEIVTTAGGDDRLETITARLSAVLDPAVTDARRRRLLGRSVTTADVLLALGMVASLVARTPAAQRRSTAEACWTMLRRALGN